MKLLLDSHVVIWWFTSDDRLSATAARLIEEGDCIVSAVSAYEIAAKVRIGKLDIARPLAANFQEYCSIEEFTYLAVTVEHALRAANLASEHRDPFDRFLAAQSQLENVPIISRDPALVRLGSLVIW